MSSESLETTSASTPLAHPATAPSVPSEAPDIPELSDLPPPPVGAPVEAPEAVARTRRGRRRQRVRARKVTRVIRRVEPWSVLRVSVVLYACLWLVLTVAGVILWQVARATGTLDNVEDFLATALADRSFTIDGKRVLLSSLAAGGVLLFAGTGLTVLLAVLFNLVSELTGGVRVAVVELETATPVAESSDDGGDVDGSSSPDDGG